MAFYVKGFLVLFVVVSVLLHLPPGRVYQKYIRFFAQFVLTLALLTPVLSFFGDGERFQKLIAYEEFTEELAQVAQDMKQVEYLYGDYHREAYEQAIAEDVSRIAQGYDFTVQECDVRLSGEYEVDSIVLTVLENDERPETVSRVVIDQVVREETEHIAFAGLRQELTDFYGLDGEGLVIQYAGGREG